MTEGQKAFLKTTAKYAVIGGATFGAFWIAKGILKVICNRFPPPNKVPKTDPDTVSSSREDE